jgi:glycosyltransferase involved in cell wall biosynthesis
MLDKINQPMVSIGLTVWNGDTFLAQTLESLLSQEYKNIEIIILDNQSTDCTSDICRDFEKKDSRVRYILDDAQRDVMQAQKLTPQLANGDFFMVACDDDWYDPKYISTLMHLFELNPKIGLAYSAFDYIYPDGSISPSGMNRFLTDKNSEFSNFISYLFWRKPIPIAFGVIRTDVHKDALSYYCRPDQRGWDHDNLYLLRLLSQTRVDSTPNVLFYYRQQDRVALYNKRGQYQKNRNKLASHLNNLQHQIAVTRAVDKIITVSKFSPSYKKILIAYNYIVLFYRCAPIYLLRYILKNSMVSKMLGKPY